MSKVLRAGSMAMEAVRVEKSLTVVSDWLFWAMLCVYFN